MYFLCVAGVVLQLQMQLTSIIIIINISLNISKHYRGKTPILIGQH